MTNIQQASSLEIFHWIFNILKASSHQNQGSSTQYPASTTNTG